VCFSLSRKQRLLTLSIGGFPSPQRVVRGPPKIHHPGAPPHRSSPSMSHARASTLWRCPLPGTHPHKASASPIRRELPTARPQGASACSRCSFLMATACHLAAPLGLAPLPRGCASAGVVAVARCGEIEHLRRIPALLLLVLTPAADH
jgi:hypothetical protein